MPVAESFNGGRGNGFPFCPTRVDVDSYDRWTTYSGYNKDSAGAPSAASIALSLELAMREFWNVNAMLATVVTSGGQGENLTDVTVTQIINDESSDPLTPSDRVCKSGIIAWKRSADGQSSVRFESNVSRMYLAGEFIGYGSRDRAYSNNIGVSTNTANGASAAVGLGGFANETPSSSFQIYDYAYVNMNGIHYVCEATAADGFSFTSSADAASMTASSELGSFTPPRLADVAITGLDFYTY